MLQASSKAETKLKNFNSNQFKPSEINESIIPSVISI